MNQFNVCIPHQKKYDNPSHIYKARSDKCAYSLKISYSQTPLRPIFLSTNYLIGRWVSLQFKKEDVKLIGLRPLRSRTHRRALMRRAIKAERGQTWSNDQITRTLTEDLNILTFLFDKSQILFWSNVHLNIGRVTNVIRIPWHNITIIRPHHKRADAVTDEAANQPTK